MKHPRVVLSNFKRVTKPHFFRLTLKFYFSNTSSLVVDILYIRLLVQFAKILPFSILCPNATLQNQNLSATAVTVKRDKIIKLSIDEDKFLIVVNTRQ